MTILLNIDYFSAFSVFSVAQENRVNQWNLCLIQLVIDFFSVPSEPFLGCRARAEGSFAERGRQRQGPNSAPKVIDKFDKKSLHFYSLN